MRTRRILAIAVVVLVIVSAGCTGWGTDGPVNQNRNESGGTNGTDELGPTGNDDSASNAFESSEGPSEANARPDSSDSDDSSAESASSSSDDDSIGTADAANGGDESSDGGETTPDPGTDSGAAPDDADSGTDSSDQEQDRTDDTDADAGSENDSDDGDTNDGAGTDASDGSDDDSSDGDETDVTDGDDDDSDEGSDTNEADDAERNSSTDDTDPETHTLTVHAGESVPVSDIPITLERHSDGATTTRETGEDGQVEFTVVDGDYTVSGTDPNGTTDSADVTVDGEDTEVLLARLAPALPAEHDVRVTVTDAETGEPIEGAVLEGVGNRHPRTGDMFLSVTTGADGIGESTAFESPYESTIRADGYEEQSETIVVDGETSLEYRLEPETTGPSANATSGNATNATPA